MAGDFSMVINKFVERTNADIKVVVRKIAFEAFKRIILRTPVDTGRARANWSVTISVPNTAFITEGADKSGASAMQQAQETTEKFNCEGSIFMTNNLPYIIPLEYGGFPSPPKNGSKTAGGFSIQAPRGMVRITMEEMIGFISKATITSIKNRTSIY